MLRYLSILSFLFFISCLSKAQEYVYQEGDIWFQDLDCGPFCEAIEKVTEGKNGAKLSHMGLLIKTDNDEWALIEAVSKGVVITSISDFLGRSKDEDGNPKIIVGRLNNSKDFIEKAINRAKSYLGRPYDEVFDIANEGLYCSELIYFSFRDEYDQSIFNLNPMTFKDPDTKKTFQAWEDYYKELGVAIPEGELGLNPGGISKSPYIDIIHVMGKPEGWTN